MKLTNYEEVEARIVGDFMAELSLIIMIAIVGFCFFSQPTTGGTTERRKRIQASHWAYRAQRANQRKNE